MVSTGLPAFRPTNCLRQLVTVIGLCALLHAVSADAVRGDPSADWAPGSDVIKNSERMIRIKRLRPADPESREIMLAGRDIADVDRTVTLSQA